MDNHSERFEGMKAEVVAKEGKVSAGLQDACELDQDDENSDNMSGSGSPDRDFTNGEDATQSVVDQKTNIVRASESNHNNTHVESDRTKLALEFEDALQSKTDAMDGEDLDVTPQARNEIGATDSVVQSDVEVELDESSMDVSQPLRTSSPDILESPRRFRPRNTSLPPPPPPPPPAPPSTNNQKRARRRRGGGGPWKCEYCGRVFPHNSAYTIHLRVHTGEKPHKCEECGRGFAQASNLNAHMRVHNKASRLECCGIQFFRATSYRKHRKTHTETVPRRKPRPTSHSNDFPILKCPTCGKGFRCQSTLRVHMRVHSGEKPFSCKVCGKSFTQANSVRVHEKIHWSVKTFMCMDCMRGFSQPQSLKVHVCKAKGGASTNHLNVGYRCHLCHKIMVDKTQYELHLQAHTDTERYSCEYCGQKFSLRSEVNIHHLYCSRTNPAVPVQEYPKPQITSSPDYSPFSSPSKSPRPPLSPSREVPASPPEGQLPTNVLATYARLKGEPQQTTIPQPDTNGKRQRSLLTCPVQLLTSSMNGDLHPKHPLAVNSIIQQLNNLNHKQDPRRYFCPRCGRLFGHVMRLRAHMLTHPRSKSYTCGSCGKTLASWRELWRHQRVHRQKKGRFFCSTCAQGFRFASTYLDHLRTHPELNSFACTLCSMTFAHSQGLKAHQRDWHKQSLPYSCDRCGQGFSSQRMLDRHNVWHERVRQRASDKRKMEQKPDVLPYQCATCDLMFKTVDALFQHQLCHALLEDRMAGDTGEAEDQNQANHTDECVNSTSPRLSGDAKSPTSPPVATSASPPQISVPLDPLPSLNDQLPKAQTDSEVSAPVQKSPLNSCSPISESQATNGQVAAQASDTELKTSTTTPLVMEGMPTQDNGHVAENVA